MSNYWPVRSGGARFSLDGPVACLALTFLSLCHAETIQFQAEKSQSKSVMSEILFLELNQLHLKNQQTPQIFRERSFKDSKGCISLIFLFGLFLPQTVKICSCRTFRCCWAKLFSRYFLYYRGLCIPLKGCACVCVWGVSVLREGERKIKDFREQSINQRFPVTYKTSCQNKLQSSSSGWSFAVFSALTFNAAFFGWEHLRR